MPGDIFARAFLKASSLHLGGGAFGALGLAPVQRINAVCQKFRDFAIAIAASSSVKVLAEPNPIQCAR